MDEYSSAEYHAAWTSSGRNSFRVIVGVIAALLEKVTHLCCLVCHNDDIFLFVELQLFFQKNVSSRHSVRSNPMGLPEDSPCSQHLTHIIRAQTSKSAI
jgi:hypothetical protein